MYRNDLAEIKSEKLLAELVEISKNHTIPLSFYAALADRYPYLEDKEVMAQFSFKKSSAQTLDEVRTAAKKGRDNR